MGKRSTLRFHDRHDICHETSPATGMMQIVRLRISRRDAADRIAAIRVAHLLAVRKRDSHVLAAMRAVLERMDYGRDFHARSQGPGNPALLGQTGRRAELDRPLLRLTGRV